MRTGASSGCSWFFDDDGGLPLPGGVCVCMCVCRVGRGMEGGVGAWRLFIRSLDLIDHVHFCFKK